MKPTHLLTSVAVAAMLCGTASAQYNQTTNYGSAGTTTATNNINTRYFIASERVIANLPSATLSVAIAAANTGVGDWTNPGAATFTVALQNAVFSSSVTPTALVGQTTAGPVVAPTAGCLPADITVTSGGTVGSASVSFSIANIAACNNGLIFNSANGVQLNATNANFTTTLTRQLGNTPINGGTGTTNSTTAGAFIQQLPGLSFRGLTPVPTTTVLLPDYNSLTPAGSNFKLNVRRGKGLVGTDEVNVNSDLTGTGVAGAVITAATAALGLESLVGFDRVTSTIDTFGFGSSNAANILTSINDADAAAATGTTLDIVLANSAPNAGKLSQTVTVTPTVTFAAASGFAAQTYTPVTVGRLNRQGQQTTPFTWVGDGRTTAATSVFRHTNIGTTIPTVRFILSNSSAGASFDGEYVIPAASLTVSNGEVVTNSLTLSNVAGNFGRADVVFVFDRSAATAATKINTQRFVQAPNGSLAAGPQETRTNVNDTANN